MANNDDDLIKNQGEDFNPESEGEFSMPDDPLEESEEHEDDMDLGLGEHDDEGGMELELDEFDEDHGPDELDDEEQHEPKEFKMGWKSYTGIALATIIVAGSLGVYVTASMGGGEPSPQAREVIRQKAEQAIVESRQQASSREISGQDSARAPVNVQPYPSADTASGENPVIPPAPRGGFDDMGNPNADGRLAEVRTSNSQIPPDEDQGKWLSITDKEAFQSLSHLADKNREDIDELQAGRSDYSDDFGSLDSRVAVLEKKLAELISKGPSKTSEKSEKKVADKSEQKATPKKETKPAESGSVKYAASIPKTPAQVEALQRQLAIYGYRPGKVDGAIGKNTRDAVKRMQREHGLPETGWLSQETLNALKNPKHYSGAYAPNPKTKYADHPRDEEEHDVNWFVRGLTNERAIVYRLDGMNYAVTVGTEIPGMGQVTKLDPANHQVVTAKGIIGKRTAG